MSNDKLKSPVGLRASYTGILTDKDGKIKTKVERKNIIVDEGIDGILAIAGGVEATPFKYIAMGLGIGTYVYSTTTMFNESTSGVFRKETTNSLNQNADGSIPQGGVLRLQTTFDAGEATGTLTETAIFNVDTKNGAGERMLAGDALDTPVTKGATDILTWTWEITLKRV
jgi:hypothetical protein